MSVFTSVSEQELKAWLSHYDLGTLVSFEGIASGIENTNYFVTTTAGAYVLTLFEKLTLKELPYYIGLLAHLAAHGIPCPAPMANQNGETLSILNGKPACLCTRLAGRSLEDPDAAQGQQVAAALARLHLAGASYPGYLENLRGPHWWTHTAPELMPFLNAQQQALLNDEVHYQASLAHADLPRGVIHADLFRDNVLFDGDRLGGMIDFYFACNDCWLYDLAILVNDWCSIGDGLLDLERVQGMLRAYHHERPLTRTEHACWVAMLRAGALRFWVSRLYDYHFPRPGEKTHAKDPMHFQRMLEQHIRHADRLHAAWID